MKPYGMKLHTELTDEPYVRVVFRKPSQKSMSLGIDDCPFDIVIKRLKNHFSKKITGELDRTEKPSSVHVKFMTQNTGFPKTANITVYHSSISDLYYEVKNLVKDWNSLPVVFEKLPYMPPSEDMEGLPEMEMHPEFYYIGFVKVGMEGFNWVYEYKICNATESGEPEVVYSGKVYNNVERVLGLKYDLRAHFDSLIMNHFGIDRLFGME